MPNPLLNRMLPTLLFVELISLLDEALEDYRLDKSLSFPKNGRHDLNQRIEILTKELKSPEKLHSLRQKRNDLAHSSDVFIDWADLDNAIGTVETELQNLNLIGVRPHYDFYAERSSVRESDDPRYRLQFDYKYGLKRDSEVVVRVSWSRRFGEPVTEPVVDPD